MAVISSRSPRHTGWKWLYAGFAIWIVAMGTIGAVLGTVEMGAFVPLAMTLTVLFEWRWIGWPLVVALIALPLTALFFAVRAAWQGRLRSFALFGAVPLCGALCLIVGFEGFVSIARSMQLADYRQRITLALQTGQDVETKDAVVHVGPPTTARFQQPGMLWTPMTYIGYDTSDGMADPANLNAACNERSRLLGDHFYLIDSDC